ncbi:MAG: hypothetical protein R3Y51_00985 [Rikenellaceae bacterium]
MSENTKPTSKVVRDTSVKKQVKANQVDNTDLNIKIGASAAIGAVVGAAGTYYATTEFETADTADTIELSSESNNVVESSEAANEIIVEVVLPSQDNVVQPVSAQPSSDSVQCMEVNVDGTPVYFADVNNDGVADLVASDYNQNGVIDDFEVMDISNDNVLMAEVAETPQEAPNQVNSDINFASVRVDGVTYEVADVNQDGIADYVGADLDNNGVIDTYEVADIQSENIMMADLSGDYSSSYYDNDQMAYNDSDMLDYTNDANVDEFMA